MNNITEYHADEELHLAELRSEARSLQFTVDRLKSEQKEADGRLATVMCQISDLESRVPCPDIHKLANNLIRELSQLEKDTPFKLEETTRQKFIMVRLSEVVAKYKIFHGPSARDEVAGAHGYVETVRKLLPGIKVPQ